jgi:membrane protease YdiL (CAAX protease family)
MAASGLALIGAVIIAPMVASGLATAGLHFPFPRIFDRTVMVTSFATMLLFGRRLRPLDLLHRGFSGLGIGVWYSLGGLALASAAIAVLFVLAAIAGGGLRGSMVAAPLLGYVPAAALVAVIEEGFFRAFLLAGIAGELGPFGALLTSSALFAIVHVIRSPARFYLSRFEPLAGAENLALYVDRIINPGVGPPLVGLFLLGLVLGEAFILTRRVYCSLGLHAGLVLGAKTWRVVAVGTTPRWLVGTGPVPLVAAPAAWALSAVMLIVLRLWLRPAFSFNHTQAPCRADECDSADGSTEIASDEAG